jgi:phosphoglycerate dehydrogenase-like enzyme
MLIEEYQNRWIEDLAGLPIDFVLSKNNELSHLLELVKHASIIITQDRPIDGEVIESAGQHLKRIIKLSRWAIDVDVAACQKRRLPFDLVPRLGCISVAEQSMALLLSCARKLVPGHRGVSNGAYRHQGLTPAVTRERSFAFKWLPLEPFEIFGKTLGIIGLGEIGRELTVRAQSFGMKVLYFKRYRLPKQFEEILGVTYCDFSDLLGQSDFVSVHVPHTDKTERMFDRHAFRAMKNTAYLINTARGGVIDETALVQALSTGEIAGAGLDVFAIEPIPYDHPLLRFKNVVLSPHNGGGSGTGRQVVAERVRNLITETI